MASPNILDNFLKICLGIYLGAFSKIQKKYNWECIMVNKHYIFMKSEEGNIIMPNLGVLITRQDRFHFYVALVFIILTIIYIKKVKKD